MAERPVHEGHIWRVSVLTVQAPDGHRFERDTVLSPGAVAVVPVLADPEGGFSVVLVRQYRAALDTDVLEIPAGMRDVDGEPPEDTARRELLEEAGLIAGHLEPLTVFHNAVGMTDALTHLFLATELRQGAHDRQGVEEQAMEVVQVPLHDAVAMVGRGELTDAKTVIGVLLAERMLAGPR